MVLALAGDSTMTSGFPGPVAAFWGARLGGDISRKYARIPERPWRQGLIQDPTAVAGCSVSDAGASPSMAPKEPV